MEQSRLTAKYELGSDCRLVARLFVEMVRWMVRESQCVSPRGAVPGGQSQGVSQF